MLLLMLLQMWKATAGHTISVSQDDGADDWETDPDFVVWLLNFTHSRVCYVMCQRVILQSGGYVLENKRIGGRISILCP